MPNLPLCYRARLTALLLFLLAISLPAQASGATATNGLPVLTCSNIVAECTGGLTPVSYHIEHINPLICFPPSGTGFPLGVSNVLCVETGFPSCTFTVTVVDTTSPRVTCSTNITLRTRDPGGAVASYISGASDACGIASFDCSPPPASLFPLR